MEEIKQLFGSFFKKKYMREYVIMILLTLGSFLIIPTFTLMGYIVNAIQYSSGEEDVLSIAREKGLLKLTVEGFFLSIFIFLISILFNFFAALLGFLLISVGLGMELVTAILVVFLLIFTFLFYALLVSYSKERGFVKAFSADNLVSYLTDGKFYVYILISIFILVASSLTVFGLGIGMVLSYAIVGLIIEQDSNMEKA